MNRDPRTDEKQQMDHSGGSSHRWMMIVCCIPMLVIAAALVAAGAVSPGFLVVAVGCLAMMWFMMRAMPGTGGDSRH